MNDFHFDFDNSFGVYHQLPDIPSDVSNLSLSKRLILNVYPLLNNYHNTSYDYAYWLALLMPSTQVWIESVYDRFQIDIDSDFLPFTDLNDDYICANHQRLNYNLIKDIYIYRYGKLQSQVLPNSDQSRLSLQTKHRNVKAKLKLINRIKKVLKLFSLSFLEIISYRIYLFRQFIFYLVTKASNKTHHGYILQQILSTSRFRKLIKRLTSVDIHYLALNRIPGVLLSRQDCSDFRSSLLNFDYESTNPYIIKFISNHYTKYIPDYALEEFRSYHKFFKDYSCHTLVVKCSNSLEPSFRHAFASLYQNARQIINFQHGGGYGLYDAAYHKLEKELSDSFVSWRDEKRDGTIGLVTGYSVHPTIKKHRHTNVKNILIIAPFFKPFHRYNLGVHPYYNNIIATRIIEFIHLLKANDFNVTYRPYSKSPDKISKYFGFSVSSETIESQIQSAYHIVVCKPTTAPTECLVQGRLPILFFGEEEPLNPESNESLLKLAKYGFYTPDVKTCYQSILNDVPHSTSIDDLNIVMQEFNALFGSRLSTVDQIIEVISNNSVKTSLPYNIISSPRITH